MGSSSAVGSQASAGAYTCATVHAAGVMAVPEGRAWHMFRQMQSDAGKSSNDLKPHQDVKYLHSGHSERDKWQGALTTTVRLGE